MSGAARTRRRSTDAGGIAGAWRVAATTGLVFACAGLSALWVAGPRFEAQAFVSSPSSVPISPALDRDGFAIAVAGRLGEEGAGLRAPSVLDRVVAVARGTPSRASGETLMRRVDAGVSWATGPNGTIVVSATGDDRDTARALANAASAELAERIGRSRPAGDDAVSVRVGEIRAISQPFAPVGVVAGLIGLAFGAVASVLGRWARRGVVPLAEVSAVSSAAGSPEPDPPPTASTAPALEAVSLEEVAEALRVEPVSMVFVAHDVRDAAQMRVGERLADRLAEPGAAVLLLDFSGQGVLHACDHGRFERVGVASRPSDLSEEDRSVLARSGEAYDHVVVDCGDLSAGEIALLADEDSAMLLAGAPFAASRDAEFRDAGLATLVLTP